MSSASENNGMLCGFNKDMTKYAVVTTTNRINVWDVQTGKMEAEFADADVHQDREALEARYTCLRWCKEPESIESSRKKKKTGTKERRDMVVVGTEAGEILIWDVAKGKVAARISRDVAAVAGETTVSDVATTNDGSRMFACYSGSDIAEWSLSSGFEGKIDHKAAPTLSSGDAEVVRRVCVSPDDTMLLTASTSVTIWDLREDGDRHKLRVVSGHAVPVQALSFAPDSSCFASAASDRFVSIWSSKLDDLDAFNEANAESSDSQSKKKKKKSRKKDATTRTRTVAALQSFSLTHMPQSLSLLCASQLATTPKRKKRKTPKKKKKKASTNACIHLACTASSGSVALWTQSLPSANKAPRTPDGVIVSGKKRTGDVLYASFASTAGEICVVRGDRSFPVFSSVRYIAGDEGDVAAASIEARVALKPLPALAGKRQIKTKDRLNSDGTDKLTTSTVMGLKDTMGMTRQKRDGGSDDVGSVDKRSFGERIAAWQAQMDRKAAQRLRKRKRSATSNGASAASSLSTLLDQALKSNDRAMLEHCLEVQDAAVIEATIQRLPVNRVLPFFHAVVRRLEKRPMRGSALSAWLRAVLIQRAGYLAAIPELSKHLAALSRLIDLRLTLFPKFLQLSGRLQLLLAQSDSAQQRRRKDAGASRGAVVRDADIPSDEEENSGLLGDDGASEEE